MAGLSEQEEFELLSLEREKAQTKRAPAIGGGSSLKDSFLSLIAPGGIGRMTSGASQSFDKAAYDAGSKVSEVATSAGAPAPVAAGLGTVTNVGIQALPMLGGGEAAKVANPAMERTAVWLMQKALKPGVKAQRLGQADPAIQTMLEGGYNATKGGAQKLQGHIDDLEKQISGLIENSGATVNKAEVASRIQDVVKRIESRDSTPQEGLKSVEKVYNDFMENGLIPLEIPIQKAMELKKGIYQVLREKYGTLGSETVEARKALGRGYKETMAFAEPGIATPLAQQSELIRALKLIERRAATEGNNNPLSLGVSVASAVHDPIAALGLWANSSGWAKSMLARALYQGREAIPQTVGQLGGAAVGAHMGSAPNANNLQAILDDLQRRNANQ